MAESAAFSLASKILSTIATPAFEMAYEKGVSILEAKDELDKLRVTIETIQAVLLDAEKKQEGSAAIKNWIKRVKSVLYDAEDLFDEVATEDLLKQQMMEEGSNKLSLKKKVLVSCSKLNPIVSRNSIAKKVKAIRKSLADISADIAQLGFVRCQDEKTVINMGRGEDPGWFVDAKTVIGRDKDKEIIFKMLTNESSDSAISVISIVGIGGMGKSTLAQLIYNDENVKKNFEKRWFACIFDISDEREVLGKIFQSMSEGSYYSDLGVGQLQTKIMESIEGKKYLLVLDDVWEDDCSTWEHRMGLLSSCAVGSKIIVTTRLPSVTKAVGALAHDLNGLSEDDSWSLFKRLAFGEGYDRDPRRKSLGRDILKKCSGVPLAIRSIGTLLSLENTIQEWEAIEKKDLPTVLGRNCNDKTMRVLKLSYDHLPSHLKHCFAYCCLFPEDHEFSKLDLINHWIAQGYIEPNDGESGFMHLLRRGFFQEAKDFYGEIQSCKMHDLMHDLALDVAGEESVKLSSIPLKTRSSARRVSFQISETDGTWDISTLVLNAKSLRSLLLSGTWQYTIENLNLCRLFASVKLLRTLSLSRLAIKNIPASIGELKLMRYLDLSSNSFEELPNSLVYLVNLFSLNLERCENFKVWPLNFHKLTNLSFVNVKYCKKLRLMPIGIGGMTHLQYLGDFEIEEGRGLIASVGLPQQLRGTMSIEFWDDIESDMDENKCSWQLPVSLQQLEMSGYRGMRIPGWGNNESSNNLARLKLESCSNVKYLPPLRCLPNLKWLIVIDLEQLEFMEEEDNTCDNVAYKFFPCLEKLILRSLPKLNQWWRNAAGQVTWSPSALVEFPLLWALNVEDCPKLKLKSLPPCPHIQILEFVNGQGDTDLGLQRELPSTVSCSTPPSLKEITVSGYKRQSILASVRTLEISNCRGLKSLHLASSPLQRLVIGGCKELKSVELVGAHRLQDTIIFHCNELMSIKLAVAQHVNYIAIRSCKELKSVELVEPQTPTLSIGLLEISDCKKMESLHISARLIGTFNKLCIGNTPKLRLLESVLSKVEISLENMGGEFIEHLSSLPIQHVEIKRCRIPIKFPGTPFTSLRECHIKYVGGWEILHIPSPHLQCLSIKKCRGLTSVEVEAPTSIKIVNCHELKNLRIAHPNALEKLKILYTISASMSTDWNSISNLGGCSCIRWITLGGVDGVFIERLISSSASSLRSIDISKCRGAITYTGVDWDSLPKLHKLCLPPLRPQEELPQCLVQRQAVGDLELYYDKQSDDPVDEMKTTISNT